MADETRNDLRFSYEPERPLATSDAHRKAWLPWLFDFGFPMMIVCLTFLIGRYPFLLW